MDQKQHRPRKLVIFGLGDFARLVMAYFVQDSPYEVVAFAADSQYIIEPRFMGLEVVPFERLTASHPPDQYMLFVAMGYKRMNKDREKIFRLCKERGYSLASYVSSRAIIWGNTSIGENCFIFEQSVVQPFARVGDNVIICSGSLISHDSLIGDHCYISGQAVIAGFVKIGPNCFIGANATIRDQVTVARECVIGAGATILRSTRECGVYMTKGTGAAPIDSAALSPFFATGHKTERGEG